MNLLHLLPHLRKRKPLKRMLFLDRFVLFVAVVYPFLTIPQILEIWVSGNVQGVSLFTWSSFLVLQSVLLVYGIVHRDVKLSIM